MRRKKVGRELEETLANQTDRGMHKKTREASICHTHTQTPINVSQLCNDQHTHTHTWLKSSERFK